MKNLLFSFLILSFLFACSGSSEKNGHISIVKNDKIYGDIALFNDSIILKKSKVKEKIRKIDSCIKEIQKKKGFNGCVLIAQYGEPIYKKAFGYSDIKTKKPLSTQSAFQLASVSKQFAAVAIMMLKDAGKLTYNDSIEKYFPQFPYHGITIYQLLTHRSGLPNYVYFAGNYIKNYSTKLSNADIIDILIKHHPDPYTKPNKKFHYCNTNYAILASIVEKITGISFPVFLKTFIFDKLNMKHTFVYNTSNYPAGLDITKGYSKGREIARDCLDGVVGDKGIYSTVEDLYLWEQALYTEQLVKQTTLQEAFVPRSFEKKGHKNYGYGWRIYDFDNGQRLIYHGGWWHGYSNLYIRRLPDKSAIIILSNKVNGCVKPIKESILKILDMSEDMEFSADDQVDEQTE